MIRRRDEAIGYYGDGDPGGNGSGGGYSVNYSITPDNECGKGDEFGSMSGNGFADDIPFQLYLDTEDVDEAT